MSVVSRLRPFLTGALLVSGLLVVLSTASAQPASPTPTPTPEAGLAFPIAELGNCSDLGTCATYCEDPVNHASCVSYAKEKGFYEDDPTHAAPDEFWEKVKTDLGCDSRASCETFCGQPGNQAACHEFAVSERIPGGILIDPQKESVLSAARTALDCDSYETCRSFCADSANADACTNFARQVGLRGGATERGPGECTTPETCSLYCSDPNNFSECRGVAPDFRGPGGCDGERECRSYCERNPDDCRAYAPGVSGVYVPVTCPTGEAVGPGGVCTAPDETGRAGECVQGGDFWNGSACAETPPPGITREAGTGYFEPRADMGGCTTPGTCYDYCVGNPGDCPGFNTSAPRPPDTYHPHVYYTPGEAVRYEPNPELGNCDSPGACYDFCRGSPESCQGFDPKSPRPTNVYTPNTYYTPPLNIPYFTPSVVDFYVTPMYYTPNDQYTTPGYYTPGRYVTPYYGTPADSTYTTPNYYTPGRFYSTPTGTYPTPTYVTPQYYTPPIWGDYTTPTYYTPPVYVTPIYYTPPRGSDYTTPTYPTPPEYTTPSYHTPPGALLGFRYPSPTYYTPPKGSDYTTPTYASPTYYTPGGYYTPAYYTPSDRSYASPTYYSPGGDYTTPNYYTPPPGSDYATPSYPTPTYYSPSYASPSYYTPPPGSTYTTPSYYTPYTSPGTYYSPYASPTYNTPPPGSNYVTPTYYTPYTSPPGTYYSPSGTYPTPSYAYPTPGAPYSTPSYTYPTPGGSYPTPSYFYPTPGYAYPTPGSPYPTPSYAYPTPGGSYPTPSYSYPTPGSYLSPPAYPTPSDSYVTPSYSYPSPEYYSYPTPADYPAPYGYPTPSVQGASSARGDAFFWFLRLFGLR